jgi:hypothetical protein
MKPTPTLKVLPNPYFVLDHEGMPAGAVRWDPEVGRPGTIHHIGVTVTRAVVPNGQGNRTAAYPENAKRPANQRRRAVRFQWAQEPVEIPMSAGHRAAVRNGTILAADKETARACLIYFVPPAQALQEARERAIAKWNAATGENPPIELWNAALGPTEPKPARTDSPPDAPLAMPFGGPSQDAKVK